MISIIDIDIGLRSVLRRLAQGVVPPRLVRRMQTLIPPHSIPWEQCSIIEADPQRRLRLNVNNQILERMHPADLADIVEDLSPDDREAIFESIDSEVAADTLSEMEPDVQASILESLETEKAADIVEEMSPHEAADVLAELEEQTSEDILEEMEVEPKAEVEELLEYKENSAGGLMNTEYVALPEDTTVLGAMEALTAHEEILESLNTLFLVDASDQLKAAIPLARLFAAAGATPLRDLAPETLIQVDVDEREDRITELFDKYNLLTLPVIDAEGKLAGVITADEIISLLREK
jgi:magnesium transporter